MKSASKAVLIFLMFAGLFSGCRDFPSPEDAIGDLYRSILGGNYGEYEKALGAKEMRVRANPSITSLGFFATLCKEVPARSLRIGKITQLANPSGPDLFEASIVERDSGDDAYQVIVECVSPALALVAPQKYDGCYVVDLSKTKSN